MNVFLNRFVLHLGFSNVVTFLKPYGVWRGFGSKCDKTLSLLFMF